MEHSYPSLRMKPKVLLICCSQLSYEIWAAKEMKLGPLDLKLISIPGGPAALANRDIVPDDYNSLRAHIRFLTNEFPSIEEAWGLNHAPCGHYVKHLRRSGNERKDLFVIQQELSEITQKKARAFFAIPVEVGSEYAVFEEIE